MRALLISAALLASAAFAADPAQGATLFADRCASCHTARHDAAVEQRGQAPDLVRRLKTRDPAALTKWILEPKSRKQDSACDTSVFVANPDALAHLWAYLQGHLTAPPPPRVERRRGELGTAKTWQWHNRKRGAP